MSGGPFDVVDSQRDLEDGVAARLTGLTSDQVCQVVNLASDASLPRPKALTPARGVQCLPPGDASASPDHRRPRLVAALDRPGPDHVTRARIERLKSWATGVRDP